MLEAVRCRVILRRVILAGHRAIATDDLVSLLPQETQMPTSQPLEILLATNRWATHNLIEACRHLPVEKFHQEFPLGPGSLHHTLLHILESMQHWTDVLAGREIRFEDDPGQPHPRMVGSFGIVYFGSALPDQQRTPQQLLELLSRIADDLESLARSRPVDETVTWKTFEQSFTFTRGGVLTHVTTHGMHHRAQCLNMLRHVGVDPLPSSSVHDWMMAVDCR